MSRPIEDHALIGDTHTAALVSRDGAVDWLCFPRFDSGACFASLLGTDDNGIFRLAPSDERCETSRRYRDNTLILESRFDTDEGSVLIVDFMPIRSEYPCLVRVVEGLEGRVRMQMDLRIRFDYGSVVPWTRRIGDAIVAVGGPDALLLTTPASVQGNDDRTVSEFRVEKGNRVPFVLEWFPSHREPPSPRDPAEAERETERWWRDWADRCAYEGEWRDEVVRSLITLKALIYEPTGAMVAAPTTSLPESGHGSRNWDYRYCWLRDSTAALEALVFGGYTEEAQAWRDWLLRAVAGDPSHAQVLYGIGGERRLPETELRWLSGWEGSTPVRTGNGAATQFQLDVYGEVLDAMLQARRAGIPNDEHWWKMEKLLTGFVEQNWHKNGAGLWEVRGEQRAFTHAKVMAWVALDRAVATVEGSNLDGPTDRWRVVRDQIRDDVLRQHYNEGVGAFTQFAGSDRLDASLLLMPLVGFLPPKDPRVVSTVEAIERTLCEDGLIRRYEPDPEVEGVSGDDAAFIACTFWMADALELMGRSVRAREYFERVLGLANDVGLLSEEFDTKERRMMGNFPQAFSHQWLVLVARNLSGQRPALGRHARTTETAGASNP